jgi:hypothetical protein
VAQVPWTALERQQVQVEIDRLYVLAVPSYLQEGAPPKNAEAEDNRIEEKKRKDVDAAEQQWAAKMQSMDEAGAVASKPGYLQGIINIVLGNLKLKARYECDIASIILICLLGDHDKICHQQHASFALHVH